MNTVGFVSSMEQEMLTLNWASGRTMDEGSVRAFFETRGWTLSDDDAQRDDVQFRLVDFGKANCLNFVAPLEELPQDVYDFILTLSDAPNITLGLDFVRTSPLHGTAFDIAADFTSANPTSLIEAIKLAIRCTLNQERD